MLLISLTGKLKIDYNIRNRSYIINNDNQRF